MPTDYKKTLTELLGVDSAKLEGKDEAAQDAILLNSVAKFQSDMVAFEKETSETINGLKEENATLTNRVTVLTGENETLVNTNKGFLTDLVQADLETFKDIITDPKDMEQKLLANRSATLDVLKGIKVNDDGGDKVTRLHNSRKAGQPKPSVDATEQAIDEATAIKLMNRAREIQKTQGGSLQLCLHKAKGETATLQNA